MIVTNFSATLDIQNFWWKVHWKAGFFIVLPVFNYHNLFWKIFHMRFKKLRFASYSRQEKRNL